jgi:hypothetical protein
MEAPEEGKPIANASFEMNSGNVFFGRLSNPASTFQHESSFGDFIGQSAHCGSCHDVMHNSALLEKSFAQWSNSPYKERTDQCQDCHMPRYSGQAAVGGPFRETLRRHNFPAVTIPLVSFPNRGYQEEGVRRFLRTAARMTVLLPERAQAGAELSLKVKVKNSGAGHNLPTGLSNERQMWIEVTVLGEDGQAVFRSGNLDENLDLLDQHSKLQPLADRWLVTFSDRFLNARGEEVPFVTQATQVEERSLKPLEERTASYAVPLPPSLGGSRVKARVRLLFRPFPPHALRDLGLGELVEKLPTWEMDGFESDFIPVLKELPRRTEYHVPGDFASLQEAIDHLVDGDKVLVAPGEYKLSRPLDFGEKRIEVRSLAGLEETTLRFIGKAAAKEESVVIFRGGKGAALEGFTITGGRGTEVDGARKGGGIYAKLSSPSITRNRIAGNRASNGWGGGICCEGGSPNIAANEILACRAERGGGLALLSPESACVSLKEGSFQGNTAREGGGIYFEGSPHAGSRLQLERSLLAGNLARGAGGGIWVGAGVALVVDHSTLVFNRSEAGAGALFAAAANTAQFANSILWANEPPACPAEFTYCLLDEKPEGGASTNLSTFPLFVDPTGTWEKTRSLARASLTAAGDPELLEADPVRWVGGDYHLLFGSPAIDAGDPRAPPDPDDSRNDLGRFFFEQPLKAFIRGDVDGDGVVKVQDLRPLFEHLALGSDLPCLDAADLDDNGRVETIDLLWLTVFCFSQQLTPAPPSGACGLDPTFGEGLSCAEKGAPCRRSSP